MVYPRDAARAAQRWRAFETTSLMRWARRRSILRTPRAGRDAW